MRWWFEDLLRGGRSKKRSGSPGPARRLFSVCMRMAETCRIALALTVQDLRVAQACVID